MNSLYLLKLQLITLANISEIHTIDKKIIQKYQKESQSVLVEVNMEED